ncbi:hypothetical protein [Arthrobacter nitrophenolicus]|uniref:Uncharacterized protein n=1 Tax=Arthrobacter nitrophenolicus TaxID=683150 RepID=L8TWX0_9MICC|nr:hypothetical protein [Arthrobacter nitrophenolicus]ELT45749.1 hypothetical protein G205_03386 [Arthrobacter nitrophenolicus]
MLTQNLFLQGIYSFQGAGMEKPVPIHSELLHYVPDGVVNQTLYFRGGNSSPELIAVVLMRNGVPMRYFPIGAKSDVHVPCGWWRTSKAARPSNCTWPRRRV